MSRTVKYLFTALVISTILSGCFDGLTGPQGEKGEKGDPGDQGSQGEETASIVVARISYESYSSTYKIPSHCNINYLVTDGKGNPLPAKRVDLEIIEGDATFSTTTGVLTYADLTSSNLDDGVQVGGIIIVTIYKQTSTTAKVKATVYGYDASVTTSINFK